MQRLIYKVWIEIEEYDTLTEQGETVDGVHFGVTAEFPTLRDAAAFAEGLNAVGESTFRNLMLQLPNR